MKGGYRVGAGRPKGSRNKTRNETSADIEASAVAENMTPLEYMLKVMRDPREDAGRRDRMAIAAAPYCHARKGESNGKADKMNRATIAGAGKFAPMKPPLKLVK